MGMITKAKGAPRGDGSSSGGGVKYVCNVCSNDITATVRVRCASKDCTDYDLCVPCFSQGLHNLHHNPRTHAYQVIEPHSIPIFDQGWGADEELLLLEGAEQYGLGSWADIADHIGGYREKDEVRDHYIATYVDSPIFPLPERASPGDKRLNDSIPREEFQARKKRRIEERKDAIAETANLPSVPAKPTSSGPSCHEVAGYMPGRLEFESEYFNEAEEAVQHMQFSPDEGYNPATEELDPETQLKVCVMNIYNDRLTCRTDRKRFIIGHNLLDYKKNVATEKRRTKEQQGLHLKTKPFARIMSSPDYDGLAGDLEKELNLRQAITQLQDWRRMRISTLAAGEKYEGDKAARIARNTQAIGQFDRMTNGLSGRSVSNKPAHPPEIAREVTDYTTTTNLPVRLSPHTQPNGLPAPSQSNNTTTSANASDKRNPPTPPPSTSTLQTSPPFQSQPPIPNVPPAHWTEDNAPSLHLLTPAERDLCSKLRLQPKSYIAMKERVLAEAIRQEGKLKKKVVRELVGVDTTKGGRLFEFWVEAGWFGNGARS
ncbi:Transcriptional adapter ada2 [Friedmanniomyces endolithicus]|uniref:Transcriptional adapter 2 n=1 Tax=Friedmanniomyces endolithicus TaxID=329885 RepID=A0AAN6H8W1_9PEZI|nr:Transcriptional adapter ada2 [Friedmanniomyces endolithicus]KAK0774275.1 Transcriptional adapter ada2 [Friedmanniomyces endolithicus]KAK0778478.1 Transcriptional adapter ada2 [Friedmanniomyces endolithicus]KAK0781833.1 Transcriptional adapter ada2 [Friedmanniomyces endolithicus]KAK0834248.1 Transcriptional adapter ada2 [Friedmanniomyces endolithicus]